ncbi:hypothetical protein FRC02_004527 [Tulasnella sp. 418]|nr:hypothetical protein FRC02_004527 [Tulasnella sp. 418]
MDNATSSSTQIPQPSSYENPTLRKVEPYWSALRTYVKGRWMDREILEVLSTEFRDRSVEYYRYALSAGITRVNGKTVYEGYILRNGDYFENARHRHEPPITSTPVEIIHRDEENGFIVIDKPGSVPVHGVGRYFKNSLVEILKNDFGVEKPYSEKSIVDLRSIMLKQRLSLAVNRLDRLTSGIMFIGTTADTARILTDEMQSGSIRKEYVARCIGKFPKEEIIVDQPMLTIDRQMGVNIIHPEGREAKTIFNLMFYDDKSNTSVVHCQPLTGRSHQIRVHLQYLGHPIVNDPIYNDTKVWGSSGGQGGLPVLPSSTKVDQESHQQESNQVSETDSKPIESESTEEPNKSSIRTSNDLSIALSTKSPDAYDSTPNAELDNQISSSLSNDFPTIEGGGTPITATSTPAALEEPQASPPEDTPLESHIDMIDPDVISSLFESMPPNKHRPPKNRNRSQNSNKPKQKPSAVGKRAPRFTPPSRTDNPGDQDLLPREDGTDVGAASPVPLSEETLQVIKALRNKKDESEEFSRWKDVVFKTKAFVKTQGVNSVSATMRNQVPRHIREQRQEEASKMASIDSSHLSNEGNLLSQNSESPAAVVVGESFSYCEECFLPVYPDPKPSQLYICLHALRYTTSKWSFATEMPFWATPGWVPEDT